MHARVSWLSRRLARCVAFAVVACACGDGGLKIFVTARQHGADFADDPYLTGANGIEKADSFCASDPHNPGGATYKAMLVDGVVRDAKARLDWVLRPNTTYYRPPGVVEIGTTTSAAIFGAAYRPLTHSIDPSVTDVWTGIGDASDFAVGESCLGWSDSTNLHFADRGLADEMDGDAFSATGGVGCGYFQFPIYCVEQ